MNLTTRTIESLVEEYMDASQMYDAFKVISDNWALLKTERYNWLLGDEGVVYQLPKVYADQLLPDSSKEHLETQQASGTKKVWVGQGRNIRLVPEHVAKRIEAEERRSDIILAQKLATQKKKIKILDAFTDSEFTEAERLSRSLLINGVPFYNSTEYLDWKQSAERELLGKIRSALFNCRMDYAHALFQEASRLNIIDDEQYSAYKKEATDKRNQIETERLRRKKEEREEWQRREAEKKQQIESDRKKKKRSYIRTADTRGITELIHFTRVGNLRSILETGIIPRDVLEQKGTPFLANDPLRLDGSLGASCLSVSFPNSKLLHNFIKKYPNDKWAILSLDTRVFESASIDEFYFFPNNAAGKTWRTTFNDLFLNKEDRYPENVQAEILAYGIIQPKYIKKIYVSEAELAGELATLTNIPIEVNKTYFQPRGGYDNEF